VQEIFYKRLKTPAAECNESFNCSQLKSDHLPHEAARLLLPCAKTLKNSQSKL